MAAKRDSKGRFIKTPAAYRRFGSFRFFDLPPELRNRCYRYALSTADTIQLVGDARMEPALLRASRQLRGEAASIYYAENTFLFIIRDMAGAEMVPFRRLQLRFSKDARGVFGFTVAPGVNWANLLAWLKAHHAHRRRAPSWYHRSEDERYHDLVIVAAAFDVVRMMRNEDWTRIEALLEILHKAVAVSNPTWA
ncbi:hypothetical protein LTR56_016721 [Elasticomyces elasticus]|nr:hypothetical protein LTR56_016721 [Elasticomyces elasticus]KAK3663115.1 hypothetical protein LTR22_006024 [Elasticomyces elasticus]KAK4905664.1 hypothetical protein LTR49_025053 [Elasticomyces elasticus]KAK5750633.1 hypothetical protein LTS12_019340 [Elasticomyces elasticus]